MNGVSHVLFLAGGDGRNAISGAEHHVLTLVEALATRGVDAELIVLLWKTDDLIEQTLRRLQASGVRVTPIERRPGSQTFASRLVRALDCWRRLSIALRSRRDRVVHLHMELVMQVLAARFAGCRHLVMTIHNDEPHYRSLLFRTWFRVLDAADLQFIAITEHVRRHLVSSVGVGASKVTTITYGVPPPPRPDVSRSAYGLADTDFVIGFVGRLTPQKNIPLLLKAMARRPEVRCVLVGDGELKPELQELARSLGCQNVTFLGSQPKAAGLMPLFDVLCLPSLWEGLGVVLVEAMIQGVPIIASRAGAIPEVLDDGRSGLLIDPSSVDSLCDAIDMLQRDAARRRALIYIGRDRAANVYGVSRMAAETLAFYGLLRDLPAGTGRGRVNTVQRRRICFVSTGLGRGGAEAQLFRAACGLRDRGFDVHVLSILPTDYYGPRLEAEGIPVTCLDATRTTSPAVILGRFLRHVRPLDPGAIAGFDYPGTMLARVGGAVARVPVVISSIRSENLGSRLRALALQWTDALATVTTTNSDRVAQKLVHAGAVSPKRVRVIPNGLDLRSFGPHLRERRAGLRASLGVGEHEFLWVTAGRLEEPKDYPNLLSAVSVLTADGRAMKVAIAGQGPLAAQIRTEIATRSLTKHVSLLGLRDDVAACMAAADATVLASAWEGSPNAVLESLAVGTPVVCTDVGGVREIVNDGRTGFIVPNRNPHALAAAMAGMMMRTPQEREAMGAAGRAHIEGRFALECVVDRWSELFDGLLEQVA